MDGLAAGARHYQQGYQQDYQQGVYPPGLGNSMRVDGMEDLSILYDVPFVVEAEMGSTMRAVRDILKLTQGSLLELDKEEGAPIELKINGHLIAKGEVVELDGCYAVRITELMFP
ncbi:MAG: FliM/FliN family flagellar motor switch protein [bacterium]|nr:FliM/FliN family flagellar motor switch protein [bacterium]